MQKALPVLLVAFLVACGNDYSSADQDAGRAVPETGATEAEGSGAGEYCAKQPAATFCSDFEDSKLPGPWSDVLIKNGGSVKIENRGLTARYVSNANGATASLHQTGLPIPKKSFDYAADLIVQDKGSAELDAMVARLPTPSDAKRELQITIYATGKIALVAFVGGGYTATDDLGTFPTDHTIRVALHIDVASKRATVTINGKAVGKGVEFEVSSVAPEVFLGDASAATSTPWTVRYDEVLVQID